MREIKFRALGTKGHSSTEGKWAYGTNKIEDCYGDTKKDDHFPLHMFERYLQGNYYDKKTRGEYTGLKDKNGVEIYEGDIVRWGLGFTGSWDKESWHRYAVVELFPSLQFRIIYYVDEKNGERKEKDNHIFEFGRFAYKETHKYLEVIGNIYENHEILECKE